MGGADLGKGKVQEDSNVSTLTAFTEDSIAIIGASMAIIGILLTQLTGNPSFDGFSANLSYGKRDERSK